MGAVGSLAGTEIDMKGNISTTACGKNNSCVMSMDKLLSEFSTAPDGATHLG